MRIKWVNHNKPFCLISFNISFSVLQGWRPRWHHAHIRGADRTPSDCRSGGSSLLPGRSHRLAERGNSLGRLWGSSQFFNIYNHIETLLKSPPRRRFQSDCQSPLPTPAGIRSLGTREMTASPRPAGPGWHVFMVAYGRYELIPGQTCSHWAYCVQTSEAFWARSALWGQTVKHGPRGLGSSRLLLFVFDVGTQKEQCFYLCSYNFYVYRQHFVRN